MKREYKRDLQNNYLILEAPETEEEESYALPMLEQNSVRGLLQIHSSQRDGMRCLHYEITSKQTLESLFEKKPMEYRDILMVLTGIRDAAEDMQRYLLSARHLLFAPDLIYVLPDGNGIRLCYYTEENVCPISLLAEFILKNLNHRDSAAVALGYGLYDQVGMENFSLDQTLRALLAASDPGGQEQEAAVPAYPDVSGPPVHPEKREPEEGMDETEDEEKDAGRDTGGIAVEHHERKKKEPGHFFSVIHPAVLLSFLVFVIALEIALMEQLLYLTEAGGLFFLMLAAELLINRGLIGKEKKEKPIWSDEETDEAYEALMDEMYQDEEEQAEAPAAEPIGETCCLTENEDPAALRLIHQPDRASQEAYPDICPSESPLYIGKKKGEADIILPVATVSRMHACIRMRGNVCYVQDMNSKNGTFVNGRRLLGQEEAEIHRDDVITFAGVRYRAD